MNPIDEALTALADDGAVEKVAFPQFKNPKAQKDYELWKRWDANGRRPDDLRPLMQHLQPVVQSRSKMFERNIRDIPAPVIQSEFQKHLLEAIDTYDPNRGQLNTHVSNQLKRANRFINKYQNFARIPEKRIRMISQYNASRDHLKQSLGREPTAHELADHMKTPPNQVQMLQRELRKDLRPGQSAGDVLTHTPSRYKEMIEFMPYDLNDEETAVFERVFGTNGPALGTNDIARELNMTPSKASRIKSNMLKKMKRYGY